MPSGILALAPGAGGLGFSQLQLLPSQGWVPGCGPFYCGGPQSNIQTSERKRVGKREAGSEVMGVGIGRERGKRRRRWKEGEAAPGEGGGEIGRKAESNREEEDRGKKRRQGEGGGGGSARGECAAGFAG